MPNTSTEAIRPLLQKLGLDAKEIEVYLAILPLKVARASAIAQAARQSRSHTYLVLRSLIEKGLVSEVERGKVIHFVAEPPQRLLSYLENREEEIAQLKPLVEGALPLLQNMTAPLVGKPRVTMSHGMDGMKQLYRDALREEYCAFFNSQKMYDMFGKNIQIQMLGKHVDFRGRDLLVANEAAKQFIEEMSIYEHHEARTLPPGVDFNADIIIFGDTIALFAYDEEQTIVRIENQHLAGALRAVFAGMWSAASQET